MSETPLELIVLAKCLAHWLLTGVPLVVASPFFGLMLGLEPEALAPVAASLLVGTPALTLVGAIGAALTVGLRRGGLLLAILIVPLSVPILIFGVSAAAAGNTTRRQPDGVCDALRHPLRRQPGGPGDRAFRRGFGAAKCAGLRSFSTRFLQANAWFKSDTWGSEGKARVC